MAIGYGAAELWMAYEGSCCGDMGNGSESRQGVRWLGEVRECVRFAGVAVGWGLVGCLRLPWLLWICSL